MLTRRFGRTELAMPVLSCGGMRYQQSWNDAAPIGAASQERVEACVDRALALGIRHIETARGYGTSEAQLGPALARHPRDAFILQSKVAPTEDPQVFAAHLEQSFARLRTDHLDLFAFHGLNNAAWIERVLRPGGCWDVADRFRRECRIKHIGFSTHAPTRLIVQAIETGRFDYVNLHYYYLLQDNRPALAAARKQDMGVFIISPSDKGGRLYRPPERLRQLCAPLSPVAFNDLFCWSHPEIHTLSVGAARPSDFDDHVAALAQLPQVDKLLPPIIARLEAAYEDALGVEFARRWREGLPDWDLAEGVPNLRYVMWLRNLAVAYDLVDFARERYSNLTGSDHWVPGHSAKQVDDARVRAAAAASPFRNELPGLLRQAHQLLWDQHAQPQP